MNQKTTEENTLQNSQANAVIQETPTTIDATAFIQPPPFTIQAKIDKGDEEHNVESKERSFIYAAPPFQPEAPNDGADGQNNSGQQEIKQFKIAQEQRPHLNSQGPTFETSQEAPKPDFMTQMEESFGQSFADVSIHENSEQATQMGAKAFAQGNEIHFAGGQFNPTSMEGKSLLGHELTHVVQQRQGRVQPNVQMKGFQINNDEALEQEADEMGARAARGEILQPYGLEQGSQNVRQVIQNKVIQRFDDEVVVGHVSEERREELRTEQNDQLLSDIRNWILYLNAHQAFIHDKGVQIREQYNQISQAVDLLKGNYRSAYASVDNAIQSANVSISLRQSAIDFVLGLLPGIGSSITAIRATQFTSNTVLNSIANAAQDSALSSASSRATAPLGDLQNQLTGTVEAPAQGGESAEQFTIRLMQTVNDLANFRGEVFETSSRMGLGSYRDTVSFVLMELQRSAETPETRSPGVDEDAIKLQRNNREWPSFETQLNSTVSQLTESAQDFIRCQQLWSASDNHLLKVMLWINYLASISDNHADIMDNEAIENELERLNIIGRSSYLGLNLGAYTSMSDEIMVVRRARDMKPSILRVLATISAEITQSVLRQVAGEEL